jgi:hypothetical protein
VSGHKYKIDQLANYLSRERASGIYQITQLLPPEDEAFQYRIKNVNEPHERVGKENELTFGAWLEVGDSRFDSSEIQRLYEADDYPLRKAEAPRARVRNETDGAPFGGKSQGSKGPRYFPNLGVKPQPGLSPPRVL